MNIVPFGNHLRTDQQVQRTFVHGGQGAFEIGVPAHGVAVHASNASLWKQSVQYLFQFFRSRSQKINVLTATLAALFRHGGGESAIVALHAALSLMVSEGDG